MLKICSGAGICKICINILKICSKYAVICRTSLRGFVSLTLAHLCSSPGIHIIIINPPTHNRGQANRVADQVLVFQVCIIGGCSLSCDTLPLAECRKEIARSSSMASEQIQFFFHAGPGWAEFVSRLANEHQQIAEAMCEKPARDALAESDNGSLCLCLSVSVPIHDRR